MVLQMTIRTWGYPPDIFSSQSTNLFREVSLDPWLSSLASEHNILPPPRACLLPSAPTRLPSRPSVGLCGQCLSLLRAPGLTPAHKAAALRQAPPSLQLHSARSPHRRAKGRPTLDAHRHSLCRPVCAASSRGSLSWSSSSSPSSHSSQTSENHLLLLRSLEIHMKWSPSPVSLPPKSQICSRFPIPTPII